MEEEIKIVYQHYIPDELIADFEKLGLDNQLQLEIKKEKEEQKYYNLTGTEIADIVIYIQQHTTELIVGGLLVNLAYDTFKGGLKLLWIGISKLAIKKLQSNGKDADKSKSISLRLMDKDRSVEVVLEGDVDDKQADKAIVEAVKFISSDKLNEAFKNPDFLPANTAKPRIRLKFNKEKQVWEPENFDQYKRQIEAYQKWAEENFDN